MGTPGDAGALSTDAEARADAVKVLRDLVVWRLAGPQWERVGRLLDQLGTAVAAGDLDAVRDATATLESNAPERIRKIGTTQGDEPAPEPVRERASHLVHVLTGTGPGQDAERGRAAPAAVDGHGDDSDRRPTA